MPEGDNNTSSPQLATVHSLSSHLPTLAHEHAIYTLKAMAKVRAVSTAALLLTQPLCYSIVKGLRPDLVLVSLKISAVQQFTEHLSCMEHPVFLVPKALQMIEVKQLMPACFVQVRLHMCTAA